MKKALLGVLIVATLVAWLVLRRPSDSWTQAGGNPPSLSPPKVEISRQPSNTGNLEQPLPPSSPKIEPGPIKAPAPPPVKIPASYAATVQIGPEKQELEEIALHLRNFGQRFGGNPTGTNAEITKALNGGNEMRANYLPGHPRLNEQGELLDPWGTPYFFHSNSATETEIRSAGPDQILHTKDDLVTR